MNSKVNKLEKEFIYQLIKGFICCSQYRKALIDIDKLGNKFENDIFNLKLMEIKIRCHLKITEKKIYKYVLNPLTTRKIEISINRTERSLENYNSEIEILDYDQNNFETFFQLYLMHLYNIAIYNYFLKKINEVVKYLSIGLKVISRIFPNNQIIFPKTCRIISKIYLFFGSLLIADNDFQQSLIYINYSLETSFLELILSNDLGEPLEINKNRHLTHKLEGIFTNMAVATYQKGVCEENQGNYSRAIESFNHSRWFANKFIKGTHSELAKFTTELEIRAKQYSNLFLKTFAASKNERILKEKLEAEMKEKKLKHLTNDESILLQNKFSNLITKIEGLKFNEIELNEDSRIQNTETNKMMYTVNVVNKVLSEDFKQILMDLKKIKIHNIDKETKNKIERKVKFIKTEENYRNLNNSHSVIDSGGSSRQTRRTINFLSSNNGFSNISTNQKAQTFRSSKDTIKINPIKKKLAERSSIMNKSRNRTSSINFTESKGNLNYILYEKDTFKSDFINQSKTTRINQTNNISSVHHIKVNSSNSIQNHFKIKIKKEKLAKYNFDKFISSKSFQKKIFHLDNICNRELDFQKKILKMKKQQFIPDYNYNGDPFSISDRARKGLIVKTKFLKGIEEKAKNLQVEEEKEKSFLKKNSPNERGSMNKKDNIVGSIQLKVLRTSTVKENFHFDNFILDTSQNEISQYDKESSPKLKKHKTSIGFF